MTGATTIAEVLPPEVVDEALPRRRVGRPKGSTNKSLVTLKRVQQHNAARTFLQRIINGGKIKAALKQGAKKREWCYPTLQERIRAADLQLRDAAAVQAVQAAEAGVSLGPVAVVNIQINSVTA